MVKGRVMRKWSIMFSSVMFVMHVLFAVSAALEGSWLTFWVGVAACACFSVILGLHLVDIVKEGLKN